MYIFIIICDTVCSVGVVAEISNTYATYVLHMCYICHICSTYVACMFEISVTTPTLYSITYMINICFFVVIVITIRALFAYCLQCIV